jgi:hypothetical protein
MPFILEGLLTSTNPDQTVNLAPMGVIVDHEMTGLTLRPYRTSRTYANLVRQRSGVFHTTDNVELLARAAIDRWDSPPEFLPAGPAPGMILADACQWFTFQVQEVDDRDERIRIECQVFDRGRRRDFLGFNRAQHAVLEGAILATRIGILPNEQIHGEFQRLATLVEKTGGDREHRAWNLLVEYLREPSGGPS